MDLGELKKGVDDSEGKKRLSMEQFIYYLSTINIYSAFYIIPLFAEDEIDNELPPHQRTRIVNEKKPVYWCDNAKIHKHSCTFAYCHECKNKFDMNNQKTKRKRQCAKTALTVKYSNATSNSDEAKKFECNHDIASLGQCFTPSYFRKEYIEKLIADNVAFPTNCYECKYKLRYSTTLGS